MIVPVVFATDDNYLPYLGVALYSLIRHTSPGHEYRIYILAGGGVSPAGKKRLLGMQTDNVRIEFTDVSAYMEALDIPRVRHLSRETAFRLVMDRLFPQYEKMLYLDCDIIVNRDVAELYRTDIGQAVLGASLDMPNQEMYGYITDNLGIPAETYFNAGVLLVNLPLFREYGVGEAALSMLRRRKYTNPDQDVLNILCRGRVECLDGCWNVEWHYLRGDWELAPELAAGRKELRPCYEEPYIIHYTSFWKPWAHPEAELADYFWQYAKETAFYEEILFRSLG